MKLWTSKITTEETVTFEHMGLRSWRWVLKAEKLKKCIVVGFFEEMSYTLRHGGGPTWTAANLYAHCTLYWDAFKFGPNHTYYDGPNCSFSFGFFSFHWSLNQACKKCMSDS